MEYSELPHQLSETDWDIAFVGKAIDERGIKVLEHLNEHAKSVLSFEYVPKEFKVLVGGKQVDKDDVQSEINGFVDKSILIDSTTLNFSEILVLLQALKDVGVKKLFIMYVEPKNYKRKSKLVDILHKRDFELSESINGYEAIPGHALLVTNEVIQKVVFLCGFEAERIDRVLEDSQIINSNCACIFGVPAYIPGWEMDSFDNNIFVIKERRLSGGINFCGATNPLSVIQMLENIFNGLDDKAQMFIVPLATKPMNIGAALFLISMPKDRVAVLYDHPNEIAGKGLEISKWHLYDIEFS